MPPGERLVQVARASNKVRSLPPDALARGLITASGGNHGLGVAYAGWRTGSPVSVYLPVTTPPEKASKLERWGARVILEGDVWDEANAAANDVAKRDGLTYVHPFADLDVMAGQGTVAVEILKQASSVDTLLVAIGGGGLISGISVAAKSLKPDIRVVGIEPYGAPTLHESVKAGKLVELERIETAANTLAPRRSEQVNLDIIQRHVDEIVLIDDDDMREAASWLWFEMGLGVELSAAAALAALRTDAYAPEKDENVCAVVCGAGSDGVSASS